MYLASSDEENPDFDYEAAILSKKDSIKKEVAVFTEKVVEIIKNNQKVTNCSFWSTNVKTFPYLSKLSSNLLNVPASSASIERFFSICGIVCDQRSNNSKDDLVIKRCLLKSNIEILDSL